MESITLKELSAYLPYGLKFMYDGRIHELDNLHFFKNEDEYGEITGIANCTRVYHSKNGYIQVLIKGIKPLLRPLSDLTKEIEVNGERFVPIDWFEKNVNKTISFFQAMNLNYSLNIDIETENYSQTIDLYNGYLVVQKLLEWHFDCFNLIDKGLAIDLNII